MIFKHQGDVTFTQVEEIPQDVKPIKHDGTHILALGEVTGHKHVITSATMTIVEDVPQKIKFIWLTEPATITHEEHHAIVLPPGKYMVGAEREVDHFSKTVRQVID